MFTRNRRLSYEKDIVVGPRYNNAAENVCNVPLSWPIGLMSAQYDVGDAEEKERVEGDGGIKEGCGGQRVYGSR